MTNLLETDRRRLAEAWLAVDPDPATAAEVQRLLTGPDHELEAVFGARLSFGTAGLRGRLGAGPGCMNRVVVRLVAAAIAAEIGGTDGAGHVVVGYDARHGSRSFAEDTARVVAANGLRCTLIPGPAPTPLLAFAVRHLGASAGVMVTASHNPRDDNGYKVYWDDGAQIFEPRDRDISKRMNTRTLLGDADLASLQDPLITAADPTLVTTYLDGVVGLLGPDSSRSARIAYTPLHGVARELFEHAFTRAGFEAPAVVAEQAEPDPDFPTTPFPNPEEPGVLGPLLRLASETGADVAMANDPDGDRLAVAVPNGPGWRMLTGDEVGALLADHLLRRSRAGNERMVANTVVSSRLLGRIAAAHAVEHVETLTGFKWLMRAAAERPGHHPVLSYEEALGYAVGDVVRDKDGISAALIVAELVSDLQGEGRSLLDLLDDLHRAHGVHVTGQRSIRFESRGESTSVMRTATDRLRAEPPQRLAGLDVRAITDLAAGTETLQPTDALVLDLVGARVVVRPSGTEPKLKIYGEVFGPTGSDPGPESIEARKRLNAVLDEAVSLTADFERRWVDADPATEAALAERARSLFEAIPVGVARADDLRLITRCIDLTTLSGDDTAGRVRALCARARRPDAADPTIGPTAAVCVYPALVELATELIGGADIQVASVAGAFPSALSTLDVRLADLRSAIDAGADEVDVVLNRSAFLDGDLTTVRRELEAMRAEAGPVHLKVILEVGELGSAEAIGTAAQLAVEAGADFIKTSTGKSAVSATPSSVLAMAECLALHHDETGRAVGLKIAGGVRTADDALGYLALVRSVLGEGWLTPSLFRIGASSLLTDLLADLAATERGLRP